MDVTQSSSSAFEIVFQYHTSRLHELAQYMSYAADVDCAQPIINHSTCLSALDSIKTHYCVIVPSLHMKIEVKESEFHLVIQTFTSYVELKYWLL